ncbi:MAG: CotH kinase family protein [Saprospiraceae bacterium]
MKSSAVLLLLIQALCASAQTLVIDVHEHHFQLDESRGMIVSQIENIGLYSDLSDYTEVVLSLDSESYTLSTNPTSLLYSEAYVVDRLSDRYTLYFTELPLVSISTQDTIVDDPKVHANFTYADSIQVLHSDIGIEIRGGFSQTYPKKTYDLEFWKDSSGTESENVQFGQMRKDDDWVLDALYNEPLRLRSHLATDLWLSIHTPYYLAQEPEAKAGAGTEYVELFLNGAYNGLYDLSEQIDRKQLQLASFDGSMRGELYKGVRWGPSTTFSGVPAYDNNERDWGGYDFKYPKEEDLTDWGPLYRFNDFVINSPDDSFIDSVWTKFSYENYLDYFIFLNLLRATDNTGKNVYVAKQTTSELYFYAPWDLDGCFGTVWDGTNQNTTDDILGNGFFDRVIELDPSNYRITVANKWFDYRNTLLKESTLLSLFEEQYNYLESNKLYERERLVYPNYPFDQQAFNYLQNWLRNRVSYLDSYYTGLLTSISTTAPESNTLLYPNPANEWIYIDNLDGLLDGHYRIFSLQGKLVSEGESSNSSIPVGTLRSGQYALILGSRTYRFQVN